MGFRQPPYSPGVLPPTAAPLNGPSSVNGAHEDLDAERARLEGEIAAARTRAVVARQRLASRDADVQELMRRELEATREAIADMDRRHRAALAEIDRAADEQVERILADALEPHGQVAEDRPARSWVDPDVG
jgi:DNA-binding ferritin-like protein